MSDDPFDLGEDVAGVWDDRITTIATIVSTMTSGEVVTDRARLCGMVRWEGDPTLPAVVAALAQAGISCECDADGSWAHRSGLGVILLVRRVRRLDAVGTWIRHLDRDGGADWIAAFDDLNAGVELDAAEHVTARLVCDAADADADAWVGLDEGVHLLRRLAARRGNSYLSEVIAAGALLAR